MWAESIFIQKMHFRSTYYSNILMINGSGLYLRRWNCFFISQLRCMNSKYNCFHSFGVEKKIWCWFPLYLFINFVSGCLFVCTLLSLVFECAWFWICIFEKVTKTLILAKLLKILHIRFVMTKLEYLMSSSVLAKKTISWLKTSFFNAC